MANEFLAISDGNVLTDIDREPMDLYQAYIMQKMMNGEITDMVMNNIYSEKSTDGKCIRLTSVTSVRNQ